MPKSLVLASASPRRSEILNMAGYVFEVIPSGAEEISQGIAPEEAARLNALAKAEEVYCRLGGNCTVIGADTVVIADGELMGKPADEDDAFRMLKTLSGSAHSVVTGWAVIGEKGKTSGFCSTSVEFRVLSDNEIKDYIATGEPMDKAGAYAVQEKGSVFVSGMEGDFFNVVGLPVSALYGPLSEYEIFPDWQKDVK